MAKKHKFIPRSYQAALDALDGQDRVDLDYGATLAINSDGGYILWGYDSIYFAYDVGGTLACMPCDIVGYQPSGLIEVRINRDASKDRHQLPNYALGRCHKPIFASHGATPTDFKWAAHKTACTVDEWNTFGLLVQRCNGVPSTAVTRSKVIGDAFAHFVSGMDLTALEVACNFALSGRINLEDAVPAALASLA